MKKLKVLLVGNYLPDGQVSMGIFADLMQRELKARGHSVRLIRPSSRVNRSDSSEAGLSKWLGYVDKFVLFPMLLKRVARRFDVVHICDHSNAAYIHSIKNHPHVITCHDVLAIRSALGQVNENPIRWTGKVFQKIALSGLEKAAHIACVSMNTRSELLEISEVKAENAVVIYNSLNYPYAKMERDEAVEHLRLELKDVDVESLISSSFLFHLGGNQWYKNRMGLLRIYRDLRHLRDNPPRLVMVGSPFDEEMRNYVEENDLKEWIVEIHHCSNQALCALYSLAQAMPFPSLAEGFGWPIIEAQACGCPIVAGNFAPLTEIGGAATFYCDPRNEKEFVRQLNDLLNESSEQRETRSRQGIENSRRFSPQEMVGNYLCLYQTAIEGRSVHL